MNYLHRELRDAIDFIKSAARDPEFQEGLDITFAEKETISLVFAKFVKAFGCPMTADEFNHKNKRKEFIAALKPAPIKIKKATFKKVASKLKKE